MAFQIPLVGIGLAALVVFFFLFATGGAIGIGAALFLAAALLVAIDFFFLRNVSVIVGEIIGYLGAIGIWTILSLLGVVH